MAEDRMSQQQNNGLSDTGALYAWLSRDQDGVEGIIMMPFGGGVLPLVVADYDRALASAPHARIAADTRGFPAELVRFDRAETMQKIDPIGLT